MKRKFHPWEGGEGKVTGQYLFAHTEMAKKAISERDYNRALLHLNATDEYPHNLGEGKLYGVQENDINYWKGCAYNGLEDKNKATVFWEKASKGLSEPSAAMFYNDQQPDKIFYQGLALVMLNRKDEAYSRFNKLKDYGEKHIFDKVKIDYFAVSLPDLLIWDDDLQKRNSLHCWYLIGLGCLGLGLTEKAREYFTKILDADINHVGSRVHLDMC
jgi:tetratricopeptide (TPR) repeat protein